MLKFPSLLALALVAISTASALSFYQPQGYIRSFKIIGFTSGYNKDNEVSINWIMENGQSKAGANPDTSAAGDSFRWRFLTSDVDSSIFAIQNVQAAAEGKPACLSAEQAYPPLLKECHQNPNGYLAWKTTRTALDNKGCMAVVNVGNGLDTAEAKGLYMARDEGGLTFHSNWNPKVNNNLCWRFAP
ncbi:hypothetical protein BJ684DRAFT_20001 [Piptocephalis cylindrospora]|uniref:Ricin B lectin domain-containing protein n=1 Tax=Piptocephalis cylindrospora TaxID=1907219 RepID=A0A4P9Y458_9FUNG|nr:hypothetical protein BJ684DRAFT_20001 [Piptocephalis cylindrospora]|eukprot:RKP13514.1 hypothetical protein BJ684DRAFT_20001 [Piptocephalis cylindrospora]